jgi:hypothetical protein
MVSQPFAVQMCVGQSVAIDTGIPVGDIRITRGSTTERLFVRIRRMKCEVQSEMP